MYHLLRFVVLALGLALTSCQTLAGIESRNADPLPKTCVLPVSATGDGLGKLRVAHLLPSDTNIDVCTRLSGTTYGRPVFRSSGLSTDTLCGRGLRYSEVTAPFRAAVGKTDVKIIEAGKTCSAPALAETTGIQVGSDLVITLAYMGTTAAPQVVPLAETAKPTSTVQNRLLRFVNAVSGVPLYFGITDVEKLPGLMTSPFVSRTIDFGKTPTQADAIGSFMFDENGYLSFGSTNLFVVAALKVKGRALLLAKADGAGNTTVFAIGQPGTKYPVRAVVCRDLERSQTDPSKGVCSLTDTENFSVDVFNAGLYGAFAAVEGVRAPKVIDALAQRGLTSDVLCVSEISRHDENSLPMDQKGWTQETLINAAKAVPGGYQYAVQSKADLDTPFDDPVDQMGNIPPPLGRAPCSLPVPVDQVNAAYDCLIKNCAAPADATGVTSGGTNCYSQKCGGSLVSLLTGVDFPVEQPQCFNCIILNGLSYLPWGVAKDRCLNDTRRPLAFDGHSTSLLLSRFPLVEPDQLVLTSTAFRRVAIYAKMQYDTTFNQDVDVYCIHAPPLLGSNIPYTGPYANGASPSSGAAWQYEQIWATTKIIDWIKRKSAGRKAIILGDWSSSKRVDDPMNPSGPPLIADVTPETLASLDAAGFLEAVPNDYQPSCTRCPKTNNGAPGNPNPYNVGFNDPMWTLHVHINDQWDQGVPVAASIFYDDVNAVPLPDTAGFGLAGPLSDTYGFNVLLRRP